MKSIFFTKEKIIEMFLTDYLNNFNFQHTNFKKIKYFLPLTNHFNFFHRVVFKILKKTENKQKINLICNGLFVLSQNINFILNNEFESQIIEIIKNLDIHKKSILKSLILFSGVVLLNTNTYKLIHTKYDLSEFEKNFKKALKDLKVEERLTTITNWSSFYMSWKYIFRINDDNLLSNPKNWFSSLIV